MGVRKIYFNKCTMIEISVNHNYVFSNYTRCHHIYIK